ncbi:MAG: hypothetical protein U0797_17450 [Gemmataceae bacterium]
MLAGNVTDPTDEQPYQIVVARFKHERDGRPAFGTGGVATRKPRRH